MSVTLYNQLYHFLSNMELDKIIENREFRMVGPKQSARLIKDYTLVFTQKDSVDYKAEINVPHTCIEFLEAIKEPFLLLTPYVLKIYHKHPFEMAFTWEEES